MTVIPPRKGKGVRGGRRGLGCVARTRREGKGRHRRPEVGGQEGLLVLGDWEGG